MFRFSIQVVLLLVVFAFALRKGGKPEKYVATIYFGLLLAAVGFRLVTGGWSEASYHGLQLYRFACDLFAFIGVLAVALRFNRWWVLWVGSVQLLAVMAHLIRAAELPIEPLVYAIMERWPTWIAIVLTGVGTWQHVRRMKPAAIGT